MLALSNDEHETAARCPRRSENLRVKRADARQCTTQTIARGMIERVVHPTLGEIPVVGTPLKFSRMTPGVRRAAPLRGEHTDAVLAECGLSPERIRELRDKKVIL